MNKQLTTLSLLSLIVLGMPSLVQCKHKEVAEVTAAADDNDDSWESIFNDMHTSVNRMQRKMATDFETHLQDMRNDMNELFAATATPSVQISSHDEALSIIIDGINTKEIDIKADSDRLLIKVPEATIDITVDGNLLTAYLTQESKVETTKDGAKSQSNSLSQSAVSQTIRHNVDLTKAKAQSDEKENRLTIIVPFAVKMPTQSIPVEKVGK